MLGPFRMASIALGLEEVGRRYHPDLAILNVNVHLPPADAVRAMAALGSDRVLPIHMGAFGGRAWKRGISYRREFVRLADSLAVPLAVGQGMSLGTLIAYAALRYAPSVALGPSSHDTLSAHLTARQ